MKGIRSMDTWSEKENELYNEALKNSYEGNYKEAIDCLKQIINSNKCYESKDLSRTYVTLANMYLNDDSEFVRNAGIDEICILKSQGKKAEDCLLKALELNPLNTVAPRMLVLSYLEQLEIIKMCKIIAEYNVDLKENSTRKTAPEYKQREDEIASLWMEGIVLSQLNEYAIENKNGFNELFDIHEEHIDSESYTELLLHTAFASQNYHRLSVLYQDFFRSIRKKEISEDTYFMWLVNRLYVMTLVGGMAEIESALNEVEKIYETVHEYLSFTLQHSYCANKMMALNHLGKVQEAIVFFFDMNSEFYDNTILYNVANAYLQNEEYEEALRIGSSATICKEDEMDSILMGKAYMGIGNYSKAIIAFKKAIRYIYAEKEDKFEFLGRTYDSLSSESKDEKLMKVYPSLIQAYVGKGEFEKAKATYLEMKDMVSSNVNNIDVSLIMKIEEKLVDKEKQVEVEYKKIKRQLEQSNNEVSILRKNAEDWYKKLLACQYGNKDVEINDEMWDKDISKGMIEVIDSVVSLCVRPKSQSYKNIQFKVERRFPKLMGQAKEFLITAEQIFETFTKDDMLDFAPVMVEYSRAIETMLWDYFYSSQDYKEIADKAKKYRNQGATMGAAVYVVSTEGKPLKKFHDKLFEIKEIRNNCAHINVDKEPDVRELREYIWESDLVDVLCGNLL